MATVALQDIERMVTEFVTQVVTPGNVFSVPNLFDELSIFEVLRVSKSADKVVKPIADARKPSHITLVIQRYTCVEAPDPIAFYSF